MIEYVTLTINGAKVRAAKGSLVLDVALDYGICIPHLCHMRGVTPIGACRLCIVEVVKNGKSKVTISCTLEVEQDMVILAHTEKILNARKNIAEMLVAEAPNSRAIQDIAVRCGVTNVRYPFQNKDCVLCGRCVRACHEFRGVEALFYKKKGRETYIGTVSDCALSESDCRFCGACAEVCPTGAITGPRSEPHFLEKDKCIKCRACYEICRFDAIAGDAIIIE